MTGLCVLIAGRYAGELQRNESGDALLAYADEYLSCRSSVPLSVSAPLNESEHRVGVWIEGLLSDNPSVRERWQAAYSANSTQALDLLATPLGRDCPGAVQFCPPDELESVLSRDGGAEALEESQVEQIIYRLREDGAAWNQVRADSAFSLGGAQRKTALRYGNGSWSVPYGAWPTTHILKPGVAGFSDSEVIEHLSQRTARLLGLGAADTQCLAVGDTSTLLVERYDRQPASDGASLRVHQEDICQALGVPAAQKYQNAGGPSPQRVADLLWDVSSNPTSDVMRFRDALAFNWLIAGTDAHGKNYSLLFHGDEVRLAPLYDLCSALPYRDLFSLQGTTPVNKLQLAMKIGRDYSIRKADRLSAWERMASALRLPAQSTYDRLATMCGEIEPALLKAVDELEPQFQESPYVASLVNDVKHRAANCERVLSGVKGRLRGGSSPTQPRSLNVQPEDGVAWERCRHVGVRSGKRCVLGERHKSQHRYS